LGESEEVFSITPISITFPTPSGDVIGGLGEHVVELGDRVTLRGGSAMTSAVWPHSQVSPPAIVRTDGSRVAFSLQMELSGTVGHTLSGDLEWLEFRDSPMAHGIGVAMMPVVTDRRIGF